MYVFIFVQMYDIHIRIQKSIYIYICARPHTHTHTHTHTRARAHTTSLDHVQALGGVLFIDEAYAVVQSEEDPFGREAREGSTLVLFDPFKEEQTDQNYPGLQLPLKRSYTGVSILH